MLKYIKHFIIAVVLCFALCTGYFFGIDAMTVCAEDDSESYPIRENVILTNDDGSPIDAGIVLMPGEFSGTEDPDNPDDPDDPEDPCAYGHTYLDPVYVWSDDYSSCTATRTCKYDSTHIMTETVDTIAKVTKPATYTAMGETTYTAAFTNKAFWAQTKTVANIAKLAKKANPITVKAKKVTVKYAKVKKKKQTVAAKKAFTVSKAQGKVTYKKLSGNKKITINSSGKITVKKKLKKGTYKLKVRVTAAGNTKYKAGSKTVTVTIKVK